MSALFDIVQKIQETQKAIRQNRALVAGFPKDYGLLANLESLELRALSLEESFLEEANLEHLDICTYRMFAEDRRSYPILAVGSGLSELQRWFSTVYDALKNGPKRRARLSPEAVNMSTLDFAFAFTGSVGVAMTIPSERLLVDNHLQMAIKKAIEMAKAESSEQIHHMADNVGAASIRAMYRWVCGHVSARTGAEIKWLRGSDELASAAYDLKHLVNLEQAIQETSDLTEEIVELVGNLVGADTNRHTFHLVFEQEAEIRGTMAETIGVEYTVELPKRYSSVLRKTTFVNYATDEESAKYHLLELRIIP